MRGDSPFLSEGQSEGGVGPAVGVKYSRTEEGLNKSNVYKEGNFCSYRIPIFRRGPLTKI